MPRSPLIAALALVLTGCSLEPSPPVVRVGMALPGELAGPEALFALRGVAPRPIRPTVDQMSCIYGSVRGSLIATPYPSGLVNGFDASCLFVDGSNSPALDVPSAGQGFTVKIPAGTARTVSFVGAYLPSGPSCAGASLESILGAGYDLYTIASETHDLLSDTTLALARALDTNTNLRIKCNTAPPGNGQPTPAYVLYGLGGPPGMPGVNFTGQLMQFPPTDESNQTMSYSPITSFPAAGVSYEIKPVTTWHPRIDLMLSLAGVPASVQLLAITLTASRSSRPYIGSQCQGIPSTILGHYQSAAYSTLLGGWQPLPLPDSNGVTSYNFEIGKATTDENGGHYFHLSIRDEQPVVGGSCETLVVSDLRVVAQ